MAACIVSAPEQCPARRAGRWGQSGKGPDRAPGRDGARSGGGNAAASRKAGSTRGGPHPHLLARRPPPARPARSPTRGQVTSWLVASAQPLRPGAPVEAELLCQGSGVSGKTRGGIDKGEGSRRDFRPAVPSAAFPGRLPTTSSTSLVRDAAPWRNPTGQGSREGELQAGARCVHILAALFERRTLWGWGREETEEEWVGDSEGSVRQGRRGYCDPGAVTARGL